MKIHWNWGTKLVLFMGLFMILIIGLVIMTTKQNFDLVEKDYYPKSLDYQVEIDKKNNTKNVGELIKIEKYGDDLLLIFPGSFQPQEVSGELYFYRPSDKKLDHIFDIKLDSLRSQKISLDLFQRGKYLLKINYQVGEISYLQEEIIYVKLY